MFQVGQINLKFMRLQNSSAAPEFETQDIYDNKISLKELINHKIFLSFLRNVDCIMCNLRIHKLLQMQDLFAENDLTPIIFLQSRRSDILETFAKDQRFPYTLIPDPNKEIYNKYGIESSMVASLESLLKVGEWMGAMKQGFKMVLNQRGDLNLMPADFLIDTDLKIHTAYYGRTSGDHISFDEIRKFAKETAQV